MKPELGMDVHYVSHGSADGKYPSVCRAAKITDVGENTASLFVMNPTGVFLDRFIPHDPTGHGGTWHYVENCSAVGLYGDATIVVPGDSDEVDTAAGEFEREWVENAAAEISVPADPNLPLVSEADMKVIERLARVGVHISMSYPVYR